MASVIGSQVLETIAQRLSFGLRKRTRGTPPELSVVKMIETEIIPRMLVAHEARAAPRPDEVPDSSLLRSEIAAFVELPLELEADALVDAVDAHLRRGVPLEAIYTDLLAPSARRLGILWEEDRCDFVDVTMGLWRLQEVLRVLSDRGARIGPGEQMRALFAPMPGDQHSFGAAIVQEVFALRGWDADYISESERGALFERVASTRFDLVGLTVSQDSHSDQLSSLIRALRSVSCNQSICVMIGGRVPAADPTLVVRCGADATADDPREAARIAERLVGERIAAALA